MNKKVIVVASLGLLSALAVTGVGFSVAWYSSNNILTITNLNVSMDEYREIKISESIDGPFVDKLTYGEDNLELFTPVSSMFSNEWMDRKEDMPVFRSSYGKANISNKKSYTYSSKANVGYFSKEFYLYSGKPLLITIDTEKTGFAPLEKANESIVNKMDLDDEERQIALNDLNHITDSLRFSILNSNEGEYNYTIIDPNKNKDDKTFLCGILDNDEDGYYDYDKTSGKEFVYGQYENEENIVYKNASDKDSELIGRESCFSAIHKAGIKPFDVSTLTEENGYKEEGALCLEEIKDSYDIVLEAGIPKRVVISLYIEGWDLDNTNYSINGNFEANLSFKIRRENYNG